MKMIPNAEGFLIRETSPLCLQFQFFCFCKCHDESLSKECISGGDEDFLVAAGFGLGVILSLWIQFGFFVIWGLTYM